MRILSRPMFKYGGPIKEGVMHGMKNGGLSKQFNTGLVGDERYPKTGGREHHVGFLAPLAWTGLRALARPFGSWALKKFGPGVARVAAGPKNTWGILGQGTKEVAKHGPTFQKNVFTPNWLGKQFIQDPLAKSVAGGTGMLGKGLQWTGKKVAGAGKYAFGTPSGLLFMGLPVTYYGGKYILSSTGEEITGDDLNKIKQVPQTPQDGVPGGGDPKMVGTGEWFEAEAQKKLAAKAKADRKVKLAKYMDTMGYDKAKKTAIGDALIDASAIVQQGTEEAGSLKHANWSKMINQAIQATSQRLKKPEQIREAVGLMMTKADIQKDMNADDKALAKLLTSKKIEKLNKELEGNSFRENLVAISKTMQGQDAVDTAVQVTEGKNFRGNIITDSDFSKILKDMKDESGLDDKTIIINWSQAAVDKNPDGFEDGHYTVGNNVITVKDDKVIAVE